MKKILFSFLLFSFCTFYSQQINTDLIYKVKKPSVVTSKTPVIIMLHGYGSNEEDLFALANSVDPRFLTFSLRAPYAAANNQGYCWGKLEFLPNKEFKYDYKQAVESRNKIISFISHACKTYSVDSSNVFVMGFSQGGIMAYDLAFSNPGKLKGIVVLSGFLLDETKKIKANMNLLSKVNFFIAHGNMDNIIDISKGEESAKYIQEKKIPVTFKSYDMPHSINGQELNDIKAWLKNQIDKKPEAKPPPNK